MHRLGPLSAAVLTACLAAPSFGGVLPGEIDDFEDGTTENWGHGQATGLVVNVPDGGPGGVGDNYLRVTSTGTSGPGSRMLVLNRAQWIGDYTAVGPAVEISMMLKNEGPAPGVVGLADLHVRLGVTNEIPELLGTFGEYVSTTAVDVPADGAWHPASFLLDTGSMTSVGGTDPLATVLAAVTELRIISAASPDWIGDVISNRMGVDAISITMTPVELQQFSIE